MKLVFVIDVVFLAVGVALAQSQNLMRAVLYCCFEASITNRKSENKVEKELKSAFGFFWS